MDSSWFSDIVCMYFKAKQIKFGVLLLLVPSLISQMNKLSRIFGLFLVLVNYHEMILFKWKGGNGMVLLCNDFT